MYGYLGLCKAMESKVYHILTNGEPLYDAYTVYLPSLGGIAAGLSEPLAFIVYSVPPS